MALFLIDISGSLQQTDPSNQRVTGVNTALEGLARLQAGGTRKARANVLVQLDGFSVGLDASLPWTSLNSGTIATVRSQAQIFATQNTGQDTDYYAALDGARQALANEAAKGPDTANACRAILWFTDGQYDVIDRVTPEAVAVLGRTKAYAPDVALDTPGGGQQLIARGRQLLCESGGLADRMRADGIVTIAVAIDTQIAPSDQAFLNAVATGNGCGTPPNPPSGASLQTGDLAQLVLSFDSVVSGTAGGTPLGDARSSTPCPGTPCSGGTQHFMVDKTLHRVHILSLAGDDGVNISLGVPGVATPLQITDGKSGSTTLGSNQVHFTWIDSHTCILDIDLGSSAAGDWTIIYIGLATLTAPNPVLTQINVYTDITPRIVAAPRLRVGSQGSFNVAITNNQGRSVSPRLLRHAEVTATATNPLTGQRQDIRVSGGAGTHFRLLYRPGSEVSSITLIQITIVIITIGGIQLVPIQRTYRVPIELPPEYPRLKTSELTLSAPEGTAGKTNLELIGGTHNGCVWIDPPAPQTSTPGIHVTYTGTPASRRQCLQLSPGRHRSLPLTILANPNNPGVIRTSIALHVVVLRIRIITIIIPLTLTLTNQTQQQNRPSTQQLSDAELGPLVGCIAGCTVTGHINFDHPTWGKSTLITTFAGTPPCGGANMFVMDALRHIRWEHTMAKPGDCWDSLIPISSQPDRIGHLFVKFNPGRYDGVVVLEPVRNGFKDFGSLPPPGDYAGRFYYAKTSDPGNGILDITKSANDCAPSCAAGNITTTNYHWTGSEYTPQPTQASPEPPCTEAAIATAAASTIEPGTAPYHWANIRCASGWAVAHFVYEPSVNLDGAIYIFRAQAGQWTFVNEGTGFASRHDLGDMPQDVCLKIFDYPATCAN